MRTISRLLVVSLFALASLGLVACGGGEKEKKKDDTQEEQVKEEPAPPEAKEVVLYQYRFNPNTLTIPAGTPVTFSNKDPDRHNVSIPALNLDKNLAPGESFKHTFGTTGEFAVSNRFAESPMKMTIVVQ